MTLELLKVAFEVAKVDKNAKIFSDSGWECDPTNVGGAFYSQNANIVILTQGFGEFQDWAELTAQKYNERYYVDDFIMIINNGES